jgi:hypothetical protein
MDRQKEMEFNTIVQLLTRHFTDIDTEVKKGKIAYTSTPTRTKRNDDGPFKSHPASSPRPVAAGGRSDTPKPFGKRDRGATTAGRGAVPATVRKARPPVPGHLRGIACGNTTNHFGLGCSATTCALWGTSHDKNKHGHVWKDSISEPSVVLEKPDWTALLKSKPAIVAAWTAAKDGYYKAKMSAKVSAIQAGLTVSDDSEELDDDDLEAAADEFRQDDNSSDSQVNDDDCVVSALAPLPLSPLAIAATRAEHLLSINKRKQFFGVSRTFDSNDRARAGNLAGHHGGKAHSARADHQQRAAGLHRHRIEHRAGARLQPAAERPEQIKGHMRGAGGDLYDVALAGERVRGE